MTQEQIIQGNKVFAEFMGAVAEQWYPESEMYEQSGIHMSYPKAQSFPDNQRFHCLELMKYHTSWDWLMPVVEKVEALGYASTICNANDDNNVHKCYFNALFSNDSVAESEWLETKIVATYTAILHFIHWYNQQPCSTSSTPTP